MKHLYAVLITTLAVSGNASADEGFKIENEAQFETDYNGQVEKIGPGVYLVVNGPSAGNTISIGRSGLQYDLSVQRERYADAIMAGGYDALAAESIQKLEAALARYAEFDQWLSGIPNRGESSYGAFTCFHRTWNDAPAGSENKAGSTLTVYHGSATLLAKVEFYLDNGGGGWNHYYARSSSSIIGNVFKPTNVPFGSGGVTAEVLAQNKQTGQIVSRSMSSSSVVYLSTGYITNFNWTHKLYAQAMAYGYGDCLGYASASDSEPTY